MRNDFVLWLIIGYGLAVVAVYLAAGAPIARFLLLPWIAFSCGLGGWIAYKHASPPWRAVLLAVLLTCCAVAAWLLQRSLLSEL